jgi:hypothetical protein
MITKKQLALGTLCGFVALVVWGAFSHMVLLIGVGFDRLPNEDKVISDLKTSIDKPGLFFFPGKDFHSTSPAEDIAWAEKFKQGPTGMLIFNPGAGGNPFSPAKLLWQFGGNFVTALILTIVATSISSTFWKKVAVLTLIGIATCSSVSIIYWIWYSFPTAFFLAQCVDMVVGFFLAGMVIVLCTKPRHGAIL